MVIEAPPKKWHVSTVRVDVFSSLKNHSQVRCGNPGGLGHLGPKLPQDTSSSNISSFRRTGRWRQQGLPDVGEDAFDRMSTEETDEQQMRELLNDAVDKVAKCGDDGGNKVAMMHHVIDP